MSPITNHASLKKRGSRITIHPIAKVGWRNGTEGILLVSSADNFHFRSSYRLEQTSVSNPIHSTPSYSPDSKSHRHLSLNCIPEVEVYVVSDFQGMNAHPWCSWIFVEPHGATQMRQCGTERSTALFLLECRTQEITQETFSSPQRGLSILAALHVIPLNPQLYGQPQEQRERLNDTFRAEYESHSSINILPNPTRFNESQEPATTLYRYYITTTYHDLSSKPKAKSTNTQHEKFDFISKCTSKPPNSSPYSSPPS